LSEAIEHVFGPSDWAKLGLELDLPTLQDPGSRLRKAQSWGDNDYGACIVQVVRHLEVERPRVLRQLATRPKLKVWLEQNRPSEAAELGLGQSHVPAPPPPLSASQVVELALQDAERLLHTSGPTSCVDRMHTALHGYLRDECARAGLLVAQDANLPALFKALRNGHPRLQTLGAQDPHIARVLQSLASAVDALNTLRNNASLAHPGGALLGEEEAMLMVNVSRSLFHYLHARLG